MPEPFRDMKSTENLPRIVGVIYGESGVGKTNLIRSMSNSMLINTERQGVISLRGSDVKVWDTTIDKVKMSDSLRNAWAYCNTHQELRNIVLDSVTETQMVGVDEIVGDSSKDTSQQTYGKNFRQLRSIIIAYLMLPQNVWFIAGERAREEEGGGPEIIQPDLPPALLRYLKRQTTLGMRLTMRRTPDLKTKETIITRVAQTFLDGRSWGIDRSNHLPQFIPNPNLDQIIATYYKENSHV